MFEKLFARFRTKETVPQEASEPKRKHPVIVCVHGFGRRRQHEFDNLVKWGEEDGYKVVTFDLYDLFDETDCEWMMWVTRAKDALEAVMREHDEIVLVGFSMGGVIASYLASICRVQKLILIAPAFSYISSDTMASQIGKGARSLLKNKEAEEEVSIPRSFYPAFMEVVKQLRKYIAKVECPVLLLHGDKDEVISIKSSYLAYESIPHEQKRLYIIHEGTHRLLKEPPVNYDAYALMIQFIENQIITHVERASCPDILDQLLEEKRQREQKDVSA